MTPYAFVEQVRIFHATDAIRHSAASIGQIALDCGFYDPSAFVKRFKKLTMGHPIIMGRKTFESLPGVLPGRVHYVLTGNKDYKAPEGVLLFHDVKSLMESLPEGENFVIGGEHMYKALLPYAGALYITEVEKPFDGDAFFPEIRPEDWVVTEETEGEGNIPHRFITYHRK